MHLVNGCPVHSLWVFLNPPLIYWWCCGPFHGPWPLFWGLSAVMCIPGHWICSLWVSGWSLFGKWRSHAQYVSVFGTHLQFIGGAVNCSVALDRFFEVFLLWCVFQVIGFVVCGCQGEVFLVNRGHIHGPWVFLNPPPIYWWCCESFHSLWPLFFAVFLP